MKTLYAMVAGLLLATCVMAETKPINLSLTPEIAIHDSSTFIRGLTLSIWGENEQSSLALGFVNGTTGDSKGLSWGFILNYADNYTGVQWAMANYNKGNFLGWQGGWANYTGGTMKGLQTGLVNYAETVTGLQFGFVNIVDNADSAVQIGLVNLIKSNDEWFKGLPNELAPGMIFVNWGF
jgi:hypothetical protein